MTLSEMREALRRLAPSRPAPTRARCDACDDTGWVGYSCPEQPCGRPYAHEAHAWADPCACGQRHA